MDAAENDPLGLEAPKPNEFDDKQNLDGNNKDI